MSWAEAKARELAGVWETVPEVHSARALVTKAIRETIAKCAEVAEKAGTCNDGHDCTVAALAAEMARKLDQP